MNSTISSKKFHEVNEVYRGLLVQHIAMNFFYDKTLGLEMLGHEVQ